MSNEMGHWEFVIDAVSSDTSAEADTVRRYAVGRMAALGDVASQVQMQHAGLVCPRCGHLIPNDEQPGAYPGAISRADNSTEVCSDCGQHEALEQFSSADHSCTPVSEWPVPDYR